MHSNELLEDFGKGFLKQFDLFKIDYRSHYSQPDTLKGVLRKSMCAPSPGTARNHTCTILINVIDTPGNHIYFYDCKSMNSKK